MNGHAALVRERLESRRAQLAAVAPEAVTLAADALAAMHDAAHGHAASVRAEKTPRKRIAQLMGERALAVEDLAAIALANDHGRAAVLAGLRVLAMALGHEVRPVLAPPTGLHEAVAVGMERCARAFADVTRAAADGLDEHEAAQLDPLVAAAQASLTTLATALSRTSQRTQFYRPPSVRLKETA